VDIAFQEDNAYRRNRRLLALDMDSTLIAAEVIDELARRAGSGEEVAAITERAMRGEMDFKQSLAMRLSTLAGLEESVLQEVAAQLPLSEGAERLMENLKRLGYKVAIISGGFTYFGERLAKRLGIDYVFANQLEIKDGRLTGRVLGEIVDASRKAEILTDIAAREGISLQQVVAVGDGANDLPMLGVAGLGIAYHAKPKVRRDASQSISTLGLDSILYIMGLRDREITG
jgi:phosphoserine phosphatase